MDTYVHAHPQARPAAWPQRGAPVRGRARRARTRMCSAGDAADGAPGSQQRRVALQIGLLASTTLPLAAGAETALDANNAAGLRPDGAGGLDGIDLEGIGSGVKVDRGDKAAFERKMRPKQQRGPKPAEDRRESTKAERAAQANLAVFEDDTLGFAFALGPQWEASSQQLENGGQIIAFANKLRPSKITRVVLVAQPTAVPSFAALEQAIEPQGTVLAARTEDKASGKDDGRVRVFDYTNGGNRYATLFALRVKPQGSAANWLITLTAQAEDGEWASYAAEFTRIVQSFRLLYPAVQADKAYPSALEVGDDELGVPARDLDLSEIDPDVLALPFGGKGVATLPDNPIKKVFNIYGFVDDAERTVNPKP